ncbi:hypothetical protein B296_00000955 [Ensete ventricosum]|uniref:Uncharacterized protein n=1 Tax=Ensete ventricosum TaxID=4639 RepID=A0A427AF52_ENSVE|nr:hypothetical protein B296_00000955 [Ensete ventricosum]
MNKTINVLVLDSSTMVTGRVVTLRGAIASLVERWLTWLSYVSAEVAPANKVFDLILEVIAFLRVVVIVELRGGFGSLRMAYTVLSFFFSRAPWVILEKSQREVSFGPHTYLVVGKARHIKAYDTPCNAICALNTATCSIGLPSYASCIRRPKCCRIDLSRTSNTKGDPPMLLSPSSSFDLTNSFWTSSIRWFIKRNYARSESLKSEERVFESSMLWIEVLTMGVHRLVASSGAMGLLLR